MLNKTNRMAPKGTPTALNLWVLARVFGDATAVANQLEATSVPHVRRCLKAGLVQVEGAQLILTTAGIAALKGAR